MNKFTIKTFLLLFLSLGNLTMKADEPKENWAYEFMMTQEKDQPDGFVYRTVLSSGPKTDDDHYLQKEVSPLYDVFVTRGKKSRCVGIITEVNPPRVVFEISRKDTASIVKHMETLLTDLLVKHGWDAKININNAFLPRYSELIGNVALATCSDIEKSLPYIECTAYDFHSRSGMYKGSSTANFMNDIVTQRANQRFIDKQARKANYRQSTAYADLKKRFEEKDPSTVEFVSKYLTWAGK